MNGGETRGRRMRVALFVSGRAGCGKTLLADELAWSLERTGSRPRFETVPAGAPGPVHAGERPEDADVVIMDVAGATEAGSVVLPIAAADLVVVPAAGGPSCHARYRSSCSPS